MTPPTTEGPQQDVGEIAAAMRDRGLEKIEGAKGKLADGAERVAAAVERTADELEGDGDDTVSGFGRSVASLMRQLSGGLRERDVEQFAGELAALARRNPGVFLAGSVALGFGAARFFKARAPQRAATSEQAYTSAGDSQPYEGSEPPTGERDEFDGDESLDLSSNPERATTNGGTES